MPYTTKPTVEQYLSYALHDYSGLGVVIAALGVIIGFAWYVHNKSFIAAIIALASSMVFFSAFDAAIYYHTYSRGNIGDPNITPVMLYPYSLTAYRIVQTCVQNILGLALLGLIGWRFALVYYINHATGLYDLMYYAILKHEIHWTNYDYFWLSWTVTGWFGGRQGWHIGVASLVGLLLSFVFLYWWEKKYGSD